jgi:mannitol-1-/sugar-/sorbitol-6-/2-deoxyglucose-6-phosphatase
MLEAAIFDLDGLLVDSEPFWRRTEIEVFGSLGLRLTDALCAQTTGLRIDEVAEHWFAHAPWEGEHPHEVAARIVDRMIELVSREGAPLPGVANAIDRCAARGWKLAVASSSPARLIEATLARLRIADRFEAVVSAENEAFGKPHPAVIFTTAQRLGVDPKRCLVLEDSLNGVIAAKAARARCIAVPAAFEREDPRFRLADLVLGSLEELDARALAAIDPSF